MARGARQGNKKQEDKTPVKAAANTRNQRVPQEDKSTAKDNKRKRKQSSPSPSPESQPVTPVKGRATKKQVKTNEAKAVEAPPQKAAATKKGTTNSKKQEKSSDKQKKQRPKSAEPEPESESKSKSPPPQQANKEKKAPRKIPHAAKKTAAEKVPFPHDITHVIIEGVHEGKGKSTFKSVLEHLRDEFNDVDELRVQEAFYELERRAALIENKGFYSIHADEIPKPKLSAALQEVIQAAAAHTGHNQAQQINEAIQPEEIIQNEAQKDNSAEANDIQGDVQVQINENQEVEAPHQEDAIEEEEPAVQQSVEKQSTAKSQRSTKNSTVKEPLASQQSQQQQQQQQASAETDSKRSSKKSVARTVSGEVHNEKPQSTTKHTPDRTAHGSHEHKGEAQNARSARASVAKAEPVHQQVDQENAASTFFD